MEGPSGNWRNVPGWCDRSYHQIGLLTLTGSASGYLTTAQPPWPQRILLLRDAGVSLDEIATVLDSERQADGSCPGEAPRQTPS